MSDLERYHEQVIERRPVDFEPSPESAGQTTSSMVVGVLRRWYIVLLVFFVICSIGIPSLWLSLETLYDVTGAIRVAPILSNILTGQADRGEISNYQSFMNTQAEMITSNQVTERVADDLVDRNLAFFKSKPGDLITKLKSTLMNTTTTKPEAVDVLKQAISGGIIQAEADRRTELIRITMKSADPEEAKQIVDTIISAYMAVEVSSSAQGQGQKLTILESEREMMAEKLQRQRETIHQLAQEYGTVALDGRQDMMLQRVASLLAELTRIEASRINLEAKVQLLEQTKEQVVDTDDLMKMREEYINNNPMVTAITGNVAKLEQELIVARQTLTPTNPELQRREQLLEALKERLRQHKEEAGKSFDDLMTNELTKAGRQKLLNIRAELEQAKAYEKRLRDVLATEDTQTIELGRKQLTIQELQFQLKLDSEMYDAVRRRIREVEMEGKRPARISIAYNADIASIQDKRVKYTIALIFGATACGMFLAYL
ncbi:MAG: GumC family protein, partial [Planctomycetota bacterium]